MNSTRTPEGGPYQPYIVKACANGVCDAKKDDRAPLMKYIPDLQTLMKMCVELKLRSTTVHLLSRFIIRERAQTLRKISLILTANNRDNLRLIYVYHLKREAVIAEFDSAPNFSRDDSLSHGVKLYKA